MDTILDAGAPAPTLTTRAYAYVATGYDRLCEFAEAITTWLEMQLGDLASGMRRMLARCLAAIATVLLFVGAYGTACLFLGAAILLGC